MVPSPDRSVTGRADMAKAEVAEEGEDERDLPGPPTDLNVDLDLDADLDADMAMPVGRMADEKRPNRKPGRKAGPAGARLAYAFEERVLR